MIYFAPSYTAAFYTVLTLHNIANKEVYQELWLFWAIR